MKKKQILSTTENIGRNVSYSQIQYFIEKVNKLFKIFLQNFLFRSYSKMFNFFAGKFFL